MGCLRSALVMVVAMAPLRHGVARAADRTPVTVQLKWSHCFQFAGYYAALECGFYRERGLDVTIRAATPETDVVREVVDGSAEFGVGLSSLILERAKGEPVVVLANIFQHSALALATRAESPTTSVHSLFGKRVMLDPASAEISAYLASEGLAAGDYVVVPHSFCIDDLIEGRVDAMGVYVTDDLFRLDRGDGSWAILSPRSAGIDFYGDNLFTTESVIAKQPGIVDRFVDATLEGWRYALAHQEELVEVIATRYASDRSVPHLTYEAQRTNVLVMPEVVDVGYVNPGRWERIAAVYHELGMLPASFQLDGFLFRRPSTTLPRWVLPSLAVAVASAAVGLAISTYVAGVNRRLKESQQRQLEIQSEARLILERKLKSSLAASAIAHEISQPLSRILLASHMASAQAGPEGSPLRQIAADAERVVTTIDKMSVLLRSVQTSHSLVDLKEVVTSSIHQVAQLQHDHGVTIVTCMPERACHVRGDAVQLQLMLANLLRNAIEAIAGASSFVKRIEVVVTTGPDDVRLIVTDSGPGWPGGRLDDMLLNTSKPTGTGVGLFVVAATVENHGGTVSVSAAPEGGTSVVVTLPRRPEAESTAGPTP